MLSNKENGICCTGLKRIFMNLEREPRINNNFNDQILGTKAI